MRSCAHRRAHPPGRNGGASARSLVPTGAPADEPEEDLVATADPPPDEGRPWEFVGLDDDEEELEGEAGGP
eukprot:3121743-Alexandrium_andersonii.AAC.1